MWPFDRGDSDPDPYSCDHDNREKETQDELSVMQGPYYDTKKQALVVILARRIEVTCLDCGRDWWNGPQWDTSKMKRATFEQDAIEDVDIEEVWE